MSSKFKAGLLSVTFRDKSPEAVIQLVEQAALEGIEWGGDVHVPAGDTERASRVSRMTREAGLDISAYGSYYKFEDIEGRPQNEGPDIEAVFDVAEALGTEMIRIWPGSRGSGEATADWRCALVSRACDIAEQAQKRGLQLGFEYHDNSLTDTKESAAQLLDEIGKPNVSLFWQTNREIPHEESLAGLKLLADRITNVHCHHLIKENNPPFELLEYGESGWMSWSPQGTRTGFPSNSLKMEQWKISSGTHGL